MDRKGYIAKIKAKISRTVNEILHELDANEIEDDVRSLLQKAQRGAIMRELGVEYSFSSYSIRFDSPLKKFINEVVSRISSKLVFDEVTLTDKEVKAINAAYREAYIQKLKILAQFRAEELAKIDIEAMMDEFKKESLSEEI